MMLDFGQRKDVWRDTWQGTTPESEIRMWDYYGGRQWILKYVPRHGKVIEAGCGLGRYVFYLQRLGINIDGIDFSESLIRFLNRWQKKYYFTSNFIVGNVNDLPYRDNSLSGYISLGVIEHFIDKPYSVLREAYRVLRPGGVAIVTTPSVSPYIFFRNAKQKVKDIVKWIIRYRSKPRVFFQHHYRPRKLKEFIENVGLKIVNFGNADIMYFFLEMNDFSDDILKERSVFVWLANRLENSPLNFIGAQSITVSVKTAKNMYCFLCGRKTADAFSLRKYDVPICEKCETRQCSKFYIGKRKPTYNLPYTMYPAHKRQMAEYCEFCGKSYMTSALFENYGYTKKVCENCLRIPKVNIELSNEYVKPIWRKRKKASGEKTL